MPSDAILPWVLDRAEAARLGIGPAGLKGAEFVTLRRGVRGLAGVGSATADERIAAVATQLPEHALLGGWSAARVHEVLVSRGDLAVFDGSPQWEERGTVAARRSMLATGAPADAARVVVVTDPASRVRFRRDVRVLRSVVPSDERCTRGDLTLTTPVRTAFDLARLLPTRSAVVGLDRLLNLRVVTTAELRALVLDRPGWVGIGSARHALELADGGAESPRESLLRLVWLEAGLPKPTCNAVVRDGVGAFVARVDLIDQASGLVGEYDGFWHSGSERRSDDARRSEALEALGLQLVRATASDIGGAGEDAFRARLRRAYQRARFPRDRRWQVTDH